MASDNNYEAIFKEYSFEEIRLVRDNLASEIDKQTDLLKTTVKSKYNDIIETSDAIKSMRLNLETTETSLWNLNKKISEFYTSFREPSAKKSTTKLVQSSESKAAQQDEISNSQDGDLLKELMARYSELWDHFDSGDLKSSVKIYTDTIDLLNKKRDELPADQVEAINSVETSLNRAKDMMKNYIWHQILSAGPEKTGIVPGCDLDDLYRLSLSSSSEFLIDRMRQDLFDSSFKAQIRRFQPCSYFNTQTNEIDPSINEAKGLGPGYVQIPKFISPELNTFQYEFCRVINIVAGLNLNRRSIVESLSTCIKEALEVYTDLLVEIEKLKPELRRKRAMQLYFDLLYLRILLNSSKSIELIEHLDPKVTKIADKYELLLDSIELYMISSSLMSNVVELSKSNIRLYGLLIPHLQ